jgi:Ca2+-transporting ATPase
LIELPYGLEKARTMAFTTTIFYELFFVFNCRSEKKSVFQMNPFENKKLVASVVLSILLQLIIIYVPFFHPVLETVPLGIFDWVKILALSSLGFLIIPKIFMRKSIRSVDYLA